MRLAATTAILFVTFSVGSGWAAPKAAANAPTEVRATLELQDGSRLVGQFLAETLPFRSALLGEFKLPVERIRSLAVKPGSGEAVLKAATGDEMLVELRADELRLKTSFGEVKVPVTSLKRMQIVVWGGPADLRRGLVALWSAEHNPKDSAGKHHGELMEGAGYTLGKVGEAFHFQGRSRLYVPDSPDFAMPGSFGVTGWIRVPRYSRDASSIISMRGDDRGSQPVFWHINTTTSKTISCYTSGPEDDESCAVATSPTPEGEWFHFAVVYDEDHHRFTAYLNGNACESKTIPFKPVANLHGSSTTSVALGNHCGRFHQFPFTGDVDEWAVYDRALTEAEVRSLVSLGNSGQPLLPPPTTE